MVKKFLMKPKIDFAFKEIMNDKKALKGFLAAVLNIDPKRIKNTEIDYEQLQVISHDREKRLKYEAGQKAIIFDFDYTLGDSTNGIVLSANYALRKLGYNEKNVEDIKKTIGLSLKDTYFTLVGKKNENEAVLFAENFKEKADEVMVDNTELYADVKENLRRLKNIGYKIGIVTTKYRYRIEDILNKFNANELIDFIVGGEDVKMEKPSPEGLLWAIKSLKLNKDDVLYVGDSVVDAKTAQNAGVGFAGVLTGTTAEKEFAGYPNLFIGENINKICEFFISGEFLKDGV